MQAITIDNYMSVVVDWMDGLLNKEEEDALRAFLVLHPDIAVDIDGLNEIVIPDDILPFEGKNRLKKPTIIAFKNIHEDNCQDFFIASCEGLLSTEETSDLHQFLSLNPLLKKDYQAYKLSKITPPLLIFPKKKHLYQRYHFFTDHRHLTVAVAILTVFFFSIGIFTALKQKNTLPFIVQHEKTITVEKQNIGKDKVIMKDKQETKHPQTSHIIKAKKSPSPIITNAKADETAGTQRDVRETYAPVLSVDVKRSMEDQKYITRIDTPENVLQAKNREAITPSPSSQMNFIAAAKLFIHEQLFSLARLTNKEVIETQLKVEDFIAQKQETFSSLKSNK